MKDDIFWLVLKLEINNYRVIIYVCWRILVSFRGFLEGEIFEFSFIILLLLLLREDTFFFECKWREGHSKQHDTCAHPLFQKVAHVRMHGCGWWTARFDFVTGIAAAGGDFRTDSWAIVKACKDRSIQHSDGWNDPINFTCFLFWPHCNTGAHSFMHAAI